MKLLTLAIVSLLSFNSLPWVTDFEQAKKMAQEKHAHILLTFSGSDWCGPCIRLHHEIFESTAFAAVADNKLVLINADFPRQKKNQLTKEQQQQNDKLADQYNVNGIFPLTVLLNADGKVVKQWEGFPKQGAAAFIDELNLAMHVNQ
ncbi:MAG: thioredoxin family protein [Bacteroidota bacterium]